MKVTVLSRDFLVTVTAHSEQLTENRTTTARALTAAHLLTQPPLTFFVHLELDGR